MTNTRNIQDLFNATAYDNKGDKLGAIKEIFVDDQTGQPTFVEVGHGLFGMSSSLVPLRGHKLSGDDLQLAFDKERIKDAPDLDVNNALTPADQNEIYRHYGLTDTQDTERYTDNRRDYDYDRTAAGAAAGAGYGAAHEHDNEGRDDFVADRDRVDFNETDRTRRNELDRDTLDRDDADNTIIRSEERLNVDKERVNTGEARLRKYVVEDTETVEVPVTREEVRVERHPIDGDARRGELHSDLGEDEASVTLHEERVTVNKETVPVEEVSLHKEQVRDTETVSEEVRKERIDVDGVDTDLRDGNYRDHETLGEKARDLKDDVLHRDKNDRDKF